MTCGVDAYVFFDSRRMLEAFFPDNFCIKFPVQYNVVVQQMDIFRETRAASTEVQTAIA